MESLPFILNVAAAICMVSCVAWLGVWFYAIVLANRRLRKPGDEGFHWGMRLGLPRHLGEFLFDDEHRALRRLYFSSLAGVVASFSLFYLIVWLSKRISL
jgi:hypothetical protein